VFDLSISGELSQKRFSGKPVYPYINTSAFAFRKKNNDREILLTFFGGKLDFKKNKIPQILISFALLK